MTLRKVLTGVVTAVLCCTAVSCTAGGDDSGWTAPAKGQAAALLDFSDEGRDASLRTVAFYGFNGFPGGMTTGQDGSVYVLGQKLVRMKRDRTVSTVEFAREKEGAATGVVALTDGSLVLGIEGQVKKLGPDGGVSVLAGASGSARATGTPVPVSAPAAGFRFSATPSPFGVRPDGTILITDHDVLWALKDGTLRQLYRTTATSPDGEPLLLGWDNAVDASGTAYVSPEVPERVLGRLGDVVAINADGLLSKPLLPSEIPGLPGSPAALKVMWLTGDGASGIFAQVYDASGSNGAVLHLHSGRADVLTREKPGIRSGSPCRIQHPMDALQLQCALPPGMTYRSGSLILGGNEDYVLEIRVT
ncbi:MULTISPECIES: hypothetical protein [unclassified Streptomyces]|uniref:hypothetical protein n=1 Tax=unclassified Streptomyces TaxID=2593676 RepID=UPI002E0E72F4|nr:MULTISPECIES: hypothetical protein [unclassified Streptomyces]WSR27887.1 hypothetical protein OG573_18115 [Streptomyces sp. NBC_01205]